MMMTITMSSKIEVKMMKTIIIHATNHHGYDDDDNIINQ